jgi:hypothetical protein
MMKIALSVVPVFISTRKFLRNALDVVDSSDRDEPVFQLKKVKKKKMKRRRTMTKKKKD